MFMFTSVPQPGLGGFQHHLALGRVCLILEVKHRVHITAVFSCLIVQSLY